MSFAKREIFRETETPRTAGIEALLDFYPSSSGSSLEEHSWRHVGHFGEQLCRSYRIHPVLCPAVISRVYEPIRPINVLSDASFSPHWLTLTESSAESASWDMLSNEIVDELDSVLNMIEHQTLRVSSELLDLASDALESLSSRSDEDIDGWARRLSEDVSDAVD